MTMLKERAVDIIKRMPEEKLFYVVQLLESVEELSENTKNEGMTLEQRALEDLQRFRKRSDLYSTEIYDERRTTGSVKGYLPDCQGGRDWFF